jgi:hypothetical protein
MTEADPGSAREIEPEPDPDVLDDWRWHVEGQFPEDQAPEQGYVHIGAFVAWCLLRGLLSAEWAVDAGAAEAVSGMVERRVSPCELRDPSAGRLEKRMLTAEGWAFARAYYGPEYGYARDWSATFGRRADRYDVPGDWTTLDRITPIIDRRHAAWTRAGRPELMPMPGLAGLLLRVIDHRRR